MHTVSNVIMREVEIVTSVRVKLVEADPLATRVLDFDGPAVFGLLTHDVSTHRGSTVVASADEALVGPRLEQAAVLRAQAP